MNKNDRSRLAFLFVLGLVLLVGVIVGTVTVNRTSAAANTAYLGDGSTNEGLIYVPIAIKWPLSTDQSELVSLNANYGKPIGYRHLAFQDQDFPLGGYASDATQGSGVVAEKLEQTFACIDDYGGTGIAAYQITVYRLEFDGTDPTTDSVVSYGEFIFSPIDEYVFPASY